MESKYFAFALTHPQDRTFFVLNAVVGWVAIVMGFSPGLLGHISGATSFPPPIVHVHAVVFTGWLALFTAQIWMIRSRRVDIHRRLGLLGALMVPVVVVVGMVANFVTQRIHLQAGALEPGFFILAKTLRTIRCKTCGCVTHWEPLTPEPGARHGVNLGNFDPELIASVRVRRFDGANTWQFLDE